MGKEKFQIRPYARLLTMLGEQLIKNERIALIELLKNSYDADAEWVKVSFNNFGENFEIYEGSQIVILDSGDGMTSEILKKHWLNPATPEKKLRKAVKATTEKGRIIQGEKGIGRFATLKLGRVIRITTRPKNENTEYVVEFDFSDFDDEFLTVHGEAKELFLDELLISVTERIPRFFNNRTIVLGDKKIQIPPHGTRIEISNLKGSWTNTKVEDVYRDVSRLESIFDKIITATERNVDSLFDIYIYKDKKEQQFEPEYLEKLENLLKYNSVLRIEEGRLDADAKHFSFSINGNPRLLSLTDPAVMGLKIFQQKFGKNGAILKDRSLACGSFEFGFYIFDFSPKAPPKFLLDSKDKAILRNHRIYLYRDGIRVYPYGEPEDDWLKIDAYRGTISVGHFLSNDQVVGYINITQKDNPKLRDKTNREGLVEDGNATEDFINLIQIFLAYIRQKPYAQYRNSLETKHAQDIFKTQHILQNLEELTNSLSQNKSAKEIALRIKQEYKIERDYLIQRAQTTEELAGVGLSVETASHDIMAMMGKVLVNLDDLIRDLFIESHMDNDKLIKELQSIRGGMSFIGTQLKDIQLLFKSAKQRTKLIRIKDIIEKVQRIYKRLLDKEKIELIITNLGSPLVAKTTDAVLLQLLLNLFDNSVYWLMLVSKKEKKIEIFLDGNKNQMIFSDNGPGINDDDMPYIFEPFYSGKGDEGRGLGLYIARQLLERHDYSISLASFKYEKRLSGANFVIDFSTEEK